MAVGNFDRCLVFTLKFEGGRADNPRDPGGRTNEGVTQRVYDHYRLARGLPRRTVYMIEGGEVEAIYRGQYWDAIAADRQPAGVDLLGFDIAVNSGPARARMWLAATQSLPCGSRIASLDARRMGFWRRLRTFGLFGRGWTARERAALTLARAMALRAAPILPSKTA